ncbi:DUF952 domain-containing protein [Williamsia sterculiae]|uniref:Uncharacterized conserved protein, DUF952 family n=1 Tax=Williamsia sterculiae TaxID=1344003 RepID=A0A1N7EFJ5_9NOCA|nr:DUF952 domain-containing protein [Williamsia sterculiae]SIR86665.1 Uncharacterized conserved protein, DUF952 family [Williamsia sterculiae]
MTTSETADDPTGPLVHLCPRDDWAAADGDLRPASLADQGFVHLSFLRQVHIPASALFAGRDDLLLLHIDVDRLTDPVVVEAADPPRSDGMRFPHLYGPIPVTAVVGTEAYPPNADGTFSAR